jgi:hypothetical protein
LLSGPVPPPAPRAAVGKPEWDDDRVMVTQQFTEVPKPGSKLHLPLWTYSPLVAAAIFIQLASLARGVFRPGLALVSALFIAEGLLLPRWVGVTLTETHAIVYRRLRRRVPWSQIQAITQEPFLGSRRVVLWTRQGRVALWAPTTCFGLCAKRFERDFHALGQFWLAHRGDAWEPEP